MKIKKNILSVFIGVGLLVTSTMAIANLQQSLDSMFMSNTTQPGTYNSQTRTGFIGGGLTLRTPIKQLNLATFDPPRMSAGCGGLDLYGGSFSFINSAQLTALLRMIMNNATGLMFQSAMNAICPSCASILTDFQKKIQDMNAAMGNTCAIANMALDTLHAPGAEHTKAEETENNIQTAWNGATDWFTAKSQSSVAKNTAAITNENEDPTAGNLTWKALLRSQVDQKYGFSGMAVSADPYLMKKLLMSMIGTRINTGNGLTNTAEVSEHSDWKPTIMLSNLIDPGDEAIQYYDFPTAGTIADTNNPSNPLIGLPTGYNASAPRLTQVALNTVFPGIRPYVQGILYGNPTNGDSPSMPATGSLFWNLKNCGSTSGSALCNMTLPQQEFLQLTPVALINLIKESQGLDGVMDALLPQISNMIEDGILLKMSNAIYMVTTQTWNNVKDVNMPNFVETSEKNMLLEIKSLQDKEVLYANQYKQASDWVSATRQNNPLPLNN